MLEGDQDGFKDTQANDAADEGERNPERRMNPQRRLVIDLNERCAADHHETHDAKRKKGRPIGGIMIADYYFIRKQQLIAEQNKDALGFEYMLLMEHITICARMYKEEHNVADVIDEAEEELKQVETVVVSSEKRQEVFNENLATKKQTSKIQIDNFEFLNNKLCSNKTYK